MYLVKWERWFRCGPEGDDQDYDEMVKAFDSMKAAEAFVEDLVTKESRNPFDFRVHRNEVEIVVVDTQDESQ